MKFGPRVRYKKLSGKREFRENQVSGKRSLLKDFNEYLTYLPHFLTDLGGIRHRKSPLSDV